MPVGFCQKQAQSRIITHWIQCIRDWYPNLHTQSYFLPHVHFSYESHGRQDVNNQEVLVVQPDPDPNHDHRIRDVRAHEHVLHCLRALSGRGQTKEVMMVISQLNFGQYLKKSCYAAAASLFPRPIQMSQAYRQGDFDLLIIHRHYGVITGEIKSVGSNFSQLNMTDREKDAALIKILDRSIHQMIKSETVLNFLVSDLTAVKVSKGLLLPNIDSKRLLRVLMEHCLLGQALCDCFGVSDVRDAVDLCLCSDQLSESDTPWKVTDHVVSGVRTWLRRISTTSSKIFEELSPEMYENLIARNDDLDGIFRFCGPATTVNIHCLTPPRLEIRTQGDAVSETGERLARIVLTPKQVDLLNRSPPRVVLVGPPGTGKTVVLLLQGLSWLQRGHTVNVVSTWSDSRAAAFSLHHQLLQTRRTWSRSLPIPARVQLHIYDIENKADDLTKASESLRNSSQGQICILADEGGPENKKRFPRFCEQLTREISNVFMWAAAVHCRVRPNCLQEVVMDTPLRSPAVVIREIQKAGDIEDGDVYSYATSNRLAVPDGPPVKWIRHRNGTFSHAESRPYNCEQCGLEVARVLKELRVGVPTLGTDTGNPMSLRYSDVLVLCIYPRDDEVDSSNNLTSTANGLVRGLRASHVPVRVVRRRSNDNAIRNTALCGSNEVTVTHWDNVRGLERKVVVIADYDNNWDDVLHGASRCSSQLVLFDWQDQIQN